MGKVDEINLRDTIIRTFQGKMVIIPNKDVFQNPIENYSILGKRRIDLEVGVSYNDDLEVAAQLAVDAVKHIDGLAADEEVTLFYTEFGESSINQNNITIPFPIRTLDVAWPESFTAKKQNEKQL